jgi:hypothetical protein
VRHFLVPTAELNLKPDTDSWIRIRIRPKISQIRNTDYRPLMSYSRPLVSYQYRYSSPLMSYSHPLLSPFRPLMSHSHPFLSYSPILVSYSRNLRAFPPSLFLLFKVQNRTRKLCNVSLKVGGFNFFLFF